MESHVISVVEADYDHVGQYDQDAVNGFSDEILDSMIALVNPTGDATILDAMAGNGNLTSRLYSYCCTHGLGLPNVVVLEYSHIQCALARERLAHVPVTVIWGDILTMEDFDTGRVFPDHTFDRVMLKSGNHEIPLEQQTELYANLFRVLKPGGTLVNLGFLFDDGAERDQFRQLTRFKDRSAQLHRAAQNRHFLMREELYARLHQVGFVDIRCGMHVHYTIQSAVAAQAYFPPDEWEDFHAELQAQQAKAMLLRRRGRIHFHADSSTMVCPGEITIAQRPA
jgi:ubiquinone/menaquinone biosynthesis C-methylase UbiE